MASSDAQPSHSFNIDGYLIELQMLDDQTSNITVRDDMQMITYGADAYRLNRINAKTVLAALSRLRKDITVAVASVKADSQEFVEITISVEVPLLPKVEEKIHLPLTRRLESGEALRSKLGDVKRELIRAQTSFEEFKASSQRMVYKHERSLACSKEEKHTLATLNLAKGEYLITISGLLKSNPSNYAHLTLTGVEICPGQLYAIPAEWNNTHAPFLVRAKVSVDLEDYELQLFGQYGSSYPYTLENFLLTAEYLSRAE